MIYYRDIENGRRFLVDDLGFEQHAVRTDRAGAVESIEVTHNFHRITISQTSAADRTFHKEPGPAREKHSVGGWGGVGALLDRAITASIPVTNVIEGDEEDGDEFTGVWEFTAEDPEGNLWTFGSMVALTG